MTPEQIAIGTGANRETAKLWQAAINVACLKFGISTPLRQAAFLSQIGVESAGLTELVENLNYSEQALLAIWPDHFTPVQAAEFGRTPTHPANQEAIADLAYGGRMGNTSTGDGWTYRGRGLIQLTGRANYRQAGIALGLPLEAAPGQAAQPPAAALAAAWYWSQHGCNAMADNRLIVAITQAVNGGTTGLPERQRLYAAAGVALEA
jgi:putative chitinase